MIYRVVYGEGNGYHCSCCRHTWKNEKDFPNLEEAMDFIHEIVARSRSGKYLPNSSDSDTYVEELIVIQSDVSWTIDEKQIASLMNKYVQQYNEREIEREKSEKSETEIREREEFKRLSKKYAENQNEI